MVKYGYWTKAYSMYCFHKFQLLLSASISLVTFHRISIGDRKRLVLRRALKEGNSH